MTIFRIFVNDNPNNRTTEKQGKSDGEQQEERKAASTKKTLYRVVVA